jgi:serine/threonine protein kinase
MTAERRETASPDLDGGSENTVTVVRPTTDRPSAPATGTLAMSAPPGPKPVPPAAFGRYEERRPLGVGGFGAVYFAHDAQLDRPVAINVLLAGSSSLPAEGERALQEARRLAHLRHPGIVALHDVGILEGQVYIVSD